MGKHILDLLFTSYPTLNDSVSILPGLSDHDIVQVLVNTIPNQTKQDPRNIPLYKKQIGTSSNKLWGIFSLSSSLTLLPQIFKNCGIRLLADLSKALVNLSVQGKMALVMAWISQEIRRLMRKRDKLYKLMKWSGRPNDTKKFQEYKHLVRRFTDRAYERYLGDILGINTTTEREQNITP